MDEQVPAAHRDEAAASRRRQSTRSWDELDDHLGLEVRVGTVPDDLPGAERPVSWVQITPTATRVQFAGDRALLVENGRTITVQWGDGRDDPGSDTDADSDADRSWVVQGWGVLLATLQRGQLCLHASTVEIGDEVVALAGRQGAGKSTTSLGLRTRGHRLLVDDTCILDLRPDGAWMQPYSRNVHLLPDSAEALGIDFATLPPLAGGRMKASYLAEEAPIDQRRLDRIVVIIPTESVTEPTLAEVHGLARVEVVRAHVARRGLAPLLLGTENFFHQLARLADSTRVLALRRPADRWSLDDVLDLIERAA